MRNEYWSKNFDLQFFLDEFQVCSMWNSIHAHKVYKGHFGFMRTHWQTGNLSTECGNSKLKPPVILFQMRLLTNCVKTILESTTN